MMSQNNPKVTALQRSLLNILLVHFNHQKSCHLKIFEDATDLKIGVLLNNLAQLIQRGWVNEEKGFYQIIENKYEVIKKALSDRIQQSYEVKEVIDTVTLINCRESHHHDPLMNKSLNMEQVYLSEFDFKLLLHHFSEVKKLMSQAKKHHPIHPIDQFKVGHYVFWGHQSCQNYWQGLKQKYLA